MKVQKPNNHKTPTPLLFFYDSISISSSYIPPEIGKYDPVNFCWNPVTSFFFFSGVLILNSLILKSPQPHTPGIAFRIWGAGVGEVRSSATWGGGRGAPAKLLPCPSPPPSLLASSSLLTRAEMLWPGNLPATPFPSASSAELVQRPLLVPRRTVYMLPCALPFSAPRGTGLIAGLLARVSSATLCFLEAGVAECRVYLYSHPSGMPGSRNYPWRPCASQLRHSTDVAFLSGLAPSGQNLKGKHAFSLFLAFFRM